MKKEDEVWFPMRQLSTWDQNDTEINNYRLLYDLQQWAKPLPIVEFSSSFGEMCQELDVCYRFNHVPSIGSSARLFGTRKSLATIKTQKKRIHHTENKQDRNDALLQW